MKKLIVIFIIILMSRNSISVYAPASNIDFVRKCASIFGCFLSNNDSDESGVNIEYLLKTIDMCNNGNTDYGNSAMATHDWVSIYDAENKFKNLLIKNNKYLNFTGTEYINTGIAPTGDIRVFVEYRLATTITDSMVIWGGRSSGWNGVSMTIRNSYLDCQGSIGGMNKTSNRILINKTDKYIGLYDYGYCYSDCTFLGVFPTVLYTGITTPYPIFLGVLDENGSVYKFSDTYFRGKIYSFKIFKSDVLLLDFVPYYNESIGKWGMWDNVSDTFFGNSGTGAFSGGQDYL